MILLVEGKHREEEEGRSLIALLGSIAESVTTMWAPLGKWLIGLGKK
jgi:hypothetical protein